MRVRDGQNLGILTILIVSLAIYGGTLLHDQQSLSGLPLPWGNQGSGKMAAEVTGSQYADGVYFFPEGMDIENILKNINIEGKIDAATVIYDKNAIAIFTAGGELTISDMPATRRLALGVPIDLNRASTEDLSLVPGIGERMAFEIVRRRQSVGKFTALSDLTTVPGIKEKKVNSLKKYLTVGLTSG